MLDGDSDARIDPGHASEREPAVIGSMVPTKKFRLGTSSSAGTLKDTINWLDVTHVPSESAWVKYPRHLVLHLSLPSHTSTAIPST